MHIIHIFHHWIKAGFWRLLVNNIEQQKVLKKYVCLAKTEQCFTYISIPVYHFHCSMYDENLKVFRN